MNALQQSITQLQSAWGNLSALRRLTIMAMAIVGIIGVAAFGYLSMPGEYKPLFSNLPPEEIGAITTKLQAQGITYKLDSLGTTVMVPEDRLAQARVSIAADGLASRGGKGFELFDDSSLGVTPFVQNVNYIRALQAELARSIMQLEPIAAARVIIARPESTPFLREQRPSTASIVLKLKLGATLSRATASGIVALVARSVEGLKPENVVVVDSAGRVLSDARAGEPDGGVAGQIETRRELESYLAGKAEEMLARHLGPGRAIVRVSADMNMQRIKERRESYQPEERVVVSEKSVTSKSAGGSGSGAEGAAGASANMTKPGGSGGGSNSNQEETNQTDYLVSKTVREFEDRLGGIQRLTIATLVDLTGDEKTEGKSTIKLDDVQDIVKQAVGFRKGRDEIKVTDVHLSGSLPLSDVGDDAMQLQRVSLYLSIARNGALAVGILFALVAVWMVSRIRKRSTPTVIATGEAKIAGDDMRRFTELAERETDYLANLLESVLGGSSRV